MPHKQDPHAVLVRQEMQAQGVTVAALARRSKVSRSTISLWLSHRRSVRSGTAAKVMGALGIECKARPA